MSAEKDFLNKLYKEYGLTPDHIHKHKHYTIINRQGIELIQAKAGIEIKYDVVSASKDYAAVKAIAEDAQGNEVQTFGSAHAGNSQNNYYLEMAEKRSKSRAILMITNLYSEGVYGEDEADDFSKSKGIKVAEIPSYSKQNG